MVQNILLVSLLLSPLPPVVDGNGDLIELVCAGQEAVLDPKVNLDVTFSLTYHKLSASGPVALRTDRGRYLRKFPFHHTTFETPDAMFEWLITPERIYSLTTAGGARGKQQVGGIGLLRQGEFMHVWEMTMLHLHPGQGIGAVPFKELVKLPGAKAELALGSGSEKGLIVATIRNDFADMRIRFDPERNYCPAKMSAKLAAGGGTAESEVLEWQEVKPGVHFPRKTRVRGFHGGKETSLVEGELSAVKLGEAIDPKHFVWRFPPGIEVGDLVNGVVKRTDASGEPTLLATRPDGGQPKFLAKDNPPAASPLPPVRAMTATFEEPTPWTSWVAPAGLVILGLCGMAWAVRRFRAA